MPDAVALPVIVTLYDPGVEELKLHVCAGDVLPPILNVTLVGQVTLSPVAFTTLVMAMLPVNPLAVGGLLETVNVVDPLPPAMKVMSVRPVT